MRRWTIRSAEDLGRSIAEIRHLRGLTQGELAAQGGLSRHWLAKLERGHSTPVLEHLLRLIRRLGATVTVTFDTDSGSDADGQA
jgi:transcriptional regulator with XRE-family HTH domain